LLLGTQQIWDIKEGENADNLGPMAWLFLQENVQVQYLQKIAAQKIRLDRIIICLCVQMDFLHEVQFSAAIEAAHFPAVETGH
jgi:hypothetical protein